MRNPYHLVYREEKREIPLCVDQGTGAISLECAGARCSPVPVRVRAAHPFGQALTRSHHASHGTAPEGIMRW